MREKCSETTRPDWVETGEKLRRQRVERQESQAAAARRMGITQRLLNDIEHGRANPMGILFPAAALDAMEREAARGKQS